MLYFHKSPNLDDLVTAISKDLISNEKDRDPFFPDLIIVQNKETQTWLQSEISRRNGIAANFRFLYPSELIWYLYRLYYPDIPANLPTDRIALEVRIFELIEKSKQEFQKRGLPVADTIDAKLSLAESIADVFDLYQVYRPRMLTNWSSGQETEAGSGVWQSFLWKLLSEEIKRSYPEIPFRNLIPELLKKEMNQKSELLPESIFIFGISFWSRSFNDLVQEYSKSASVHWYDQELEDLGREDGHIRGWGKQKRELLQLFDSAKISKQTISNSTSIPESGTFSDKITIHSCHNPEREVQVLRQELLTQFDTDLSLKADDVLIMVPDIDQYSPFISKEFSEKAGGISIPFFLPPPEGITASGTMMKLLDFFLENEKVNDFIGLLELPLNRKNFEIEEDHIRFVTEAFSKMNIHHGLTISDSDHSIEKGINQLYLGFGMGLEPFQLYDQFAPSDLVPTTDVVDIITTLSSFFRYLSRIKSFTETPASVKEWLISVKDLFSEINPDELDSYSSHLDRLISQVTLGESKTEISFPHFVNWFNRHQSSSGARSTRQGTGVTISSYIPYRNIPFRYVAVLGLNEDVFPRKPFRPDFDLIYQHPEPGDRITHLDDELLFMERLVSTQNRMHLSFIGEGENGKMPSSIITRLKDEFPGLNIERHKLHGFSEAMSSERPAYYSNDSEIAVNIIKREDKFGTKKPLELYRELQDKIPINDVILYFTHPGKYLLCNELGIKNIYENPEPENRQLFDLDGLGKFKLREILQESLTEDNVTHQIKNYLQVSGVLPSGSHSAAEFNAQLDHVSELEKSLHPFLDTEPERKRIEISWNERSVNGELHNFFGDWRVEWGLGSVKSKDILSAWIEHIASQIYIENYKGAKLFGISKGSAQEYLINPVKSPEKVLSSLLEIYTKHNIGRGHFSCIPELSRIFFENADSELKAISKLENAWYSTPYHRGEGADFFNKMIWKDEFPWESPEFKSQSKLIWEPIFDHLEVND